MTDTQRGPARRGLAVERPLLDGTASNPRLLRLPVFGGLGWPTRLLGLAAGGALILAIATVQRYVNTDVPVTMLYIVPVVLAAWVGGAWAGSAAALGASVARLLVADRAGMQYSHPLVPYWTFGMSMVLYGLTAVLLAQLHRTLLHERGLAKTDPLTVLGNRRFFEDTARIELNRSLRYSRPFALAYVDVDRFKAVNDRLGHAVGDTLLRIIARVLVESIRASDVVARMSGDEFALVLPETPPEGARVAMDKVHQRLTAAVAEAGFNVSFSIGVVTYESGSATVASLLERADAVMYEVKKNGRGHVRCRPYELPTVSA